MMGSSLLVMPWAVGEVRIFSLLFLSLFLRCAGEPVDFFLPSQAGLALGVVLIFVMGTLAFFPTTLIYKAADYLESTLKMPVIEFQDICSKLLGPKVALVSLLVSLLNLVGAMVVYWILMSTMLYQIGCFVYGKSFVRLIDWLIGHRLLLITVISMTFISLIFFIYLVQVDFMPVSFLVAENKYPGFANVTDTSTVPDDAGLFVKYWNEMMTVPFYLVFLVLPVICIKKPTFFTKLSSFGIVSVLFMVIFVITKIATWGFHVKETNIDFKRKQFTDFFKNIFILSHHQLLICQFFAYVSVANSHFPALTGTLSMGFFIHNCILGMTVHHNRPQYKARDTGIAFLMTAISYAIVGGGYYAAFPHSKNLIADVSKNWVIVCESFLHLIEWSLMWLFVWLIDCSFDWLIDWLTDDRLIDMMIIWFSIFFSYDQVIDVKLFCFRIFWRTFPTGKCWRLWRVVCCSFNCTQYFLSWPISSGCS